MTAMIVENTKICPKCGGYLKYYDNADRFVLQKNRMKSRIKIRRFKCIKCGMIHRELPNYIFPYKQYDGEIIQGVKDGYICSDTFGYEDYPCEMTMLRWTRK